MTKIDAKQVLKGLREQDIADLRDALKRKDASYIRGMIQWYTRKPVSGNPDLVPFLKRALGTCSSVGSSGPQSSDTSPSPQ